MCHKLFVLTAMTLLSPVAAESSESTTTHTPEQIIERAIGYHDPNGVWQTGRIHLGIQTTYSEELAERAGSK